MELVASVVVRGGWRSLELVAEVDCAKVEVGVCLQSYLCEGCRSTKLVIKVGRAKMVVGVCRMELLVQGWSSELSSEVVVVAQTWS